MNLSSKQRQEASRARQVLGARLRVWEQRLKDLETPQALRSPDAVERLAFCRQEHAKCTEAMRRVNRGVGRQRAWVSG